MLVDGDDDDDDDDVDNVYDDVRVAYGNILHTCMRTCVAAGSDRNLCGSHLSNNILLYAATTTTTPATTITALTCRVPLPRHAEPNGEQMYWGSWYFF